MNKLILATLTCLLLFSSPGAQARFIQADKWPGLDRQPITLNKYTYANADPVNHIDPTGKFSVSSVMTGINAAATLYSTATASYDFVSSALSGEGEASFKDAGVAVLFSLGGLKAAKLFAKKIRKKTGCHKAGSSNKLICDIFISSNKRIKKIRSALNIGKHKNIAYADYFTTSGIGTMIAESGKDSRAGTVGMPSVRRYQTGFAGFPRKFDSEVKLYENLALKFNSSTKGLVKLVSERIICRSCGRVGRLFKRDFPSVFVITKNVFSY